jgi:hypothetical protein
MQTEQNRILDLLNSGRITLAEAESMLDSALGHGSLISDSRVTRIKSWLGSHMSSCLALALLTGVGLRPALTALLETGMHAIGGTEGLQLFFYRLLEALL